MCFGAVPQLGRLPRSERLDACFGPAADPQYTFAPMLQFDEDYTRWLAAKGNRTHLRLAWHRYAQVYGDMPLRLRYDLGAAGGQYTLMVVYGFAGFEAVPLSRLTVTGGGGGGNNTTVVELHRMMQTPVNRRLEYPLSPELTAGGEVVVECTQPKGGCQNSNGRGCQISEVWLVKTSPAA